MLQYSKHHGSHFILFLSFSPFFNSFFPFYEETIQCVGTEKVRSRRSYGSKRKRGEQGDRAPVDLPRTLISRIKASILLMAG